MSFIERFISAVPSGVARTAILAALFGPAFFEVASIIAAAQAGLISGALALNFCLIDLLFATLGASILIRRLALRSA